MLDYATSQDQPTATIMQGLFDELERKMSIALSGKSPLANGAAYATLRETAMLGKWFTIFVVPSPESRVWTLGDTSYVHGVFQSAVNAATVNDTDLERNLVFIADPGVDLDDSLEAHKRVVDGRKLWVAIGTPDAFIRPEKVHRFAVAEIVLENWRSFYLPISYDKYNFFRFHNGNRQSATIKFANGLEITIEPLACVTVRRPSASAVAADYEVGTYFWPFHAGDPRYYSAGYNSTRYPELSWRANNVCNPAIAFPWMSHLRADDRESVGFEFNPTVMHDLSSDYADLFGSIADGATRLGDLRIHKGSMKMARGMPAAATLHDLTWQGVENAGPSGQDIVKFAFAAGSDDLTISSADGSDADIITLGTNLLRDGATHRVIATLPVTVPGRVALTAGVNAPDVRENPEAESVAVANDYVQTNGVVKGVAGSRESFPEALPAIHPLEYRLRQRCSDLETDLQGLGTVAAKVLSVCGPTWRVERAVDVSVPGYIVPTFWSLDGQQLIEHITLRMADTGWPITGPDPLPYTILVATPTFQGPRYGRYYTEVSGVYRAYHSPDTDCLTVRGNGEDAVMTFAGKDLRDSIRVLTASLDVRDIQGETFAETAGDDLFHPSNQVWLPPDVLEDFVRFGLDGTWYSANRALLLAGESWTTDSSGWVRFTFAVRMLRPQLRKEHINHLAWLINSIQRIRPLRLWDVARNVGSGSGYLVSNSRGLTTAAGLDTTIRPRDQFARCDEGDALELLAAAWGVPVRTALDLPGNLATARDHWQTAQYERWSFDRRYTVTAEGALQGADLSPPHGTWPTRWFYRVDWDVEILSSPRYLGTEAGAADVDHQVYGDTTYRWLSHADLMARATELGLAWWYSALVRPIDLDVSAPTAPVMVPWTDLTWSEQERHGGSFDSGYDTAQQAENFAVQAGLTRSVGEVRVEEVVFTQPGTYIRWVETGDVNSLWVADVGWPAKWQSPPAQSSTLATDGWTRSNLLALGQIDQVENVPTQLNAVPWPQAPRLLHILRGVPAAVLARDALVHRGMLVLQWRSSGIASGGVLVLTPTYLWSRQAYYSQGAIDQAQHVGTYGDRGRPVTFHAAQPDEAFVIEVPDAAFLLGAEELDLEVPAGKVLQPGYEVAWLRNEYQSAEN